MNGFENDDVLKALREELNSVAPSTNFAQTVRERIAGDVDLLREELAAVEPSPEFKVRVRQQVEAQVEARRGSWLSGWRWVIPVGAAAVIVAAVVMMSRPDNVPPAPTVAQGPAQPITPVVPMEPSRSAAPPVVFTPRRDGAGPSAGRTEEPVPVLARADGPSLEVITDQPAILRELWRQIRADAVEVATTTRELSDTPPEIGVTPIEVNPIVVKLMAEPPPGPGPSPIIRRVTAETAERREQ